MSERIAKWDNLKFFLIFLVVLGHFVDYYDTDFAVLKTAYLFIYSFHIPAFLFVSGLMSKKTVDSTPFRTVRVLSLFALYLICNGLLAICKGIAQKPITFHLFGQDHYGWFMFVLPVFYLLTRAIRTVPKPFAVGFFVALGCLCGYDSSVGDFLFLSRIFVFYPFFLAGYYCSPSLLIQKLNRLWIRILSAVTLVLVFAGMYCTIDRTYGLRPLFTGRNSFEKIGELFETWGGGIRLIYYVAVFALIAMWISIMPARKTCFTQLGSRTLQVYVLHRPILYMMQTFGFGALLQQTMPTVWWIPFIGAAVVMTLLLSMKWLEPPFAYVMNPSIKNAKE